MSEQCEHQNTTFDQGEKCCTDCGLMLDEIVFVSSYNQIYSYRRQPVYSRQKRFYHFLLASKNPVIFQNLENIMTMFGKLEFFWGINPVTTRKYFFNRFVCLVFILQQLNVDTEGMRTLKDKERVSNQIEVMGQILENSLVM